MLINTSTRSLVYTREIQNMPCYENMPQYAAIVTYLDMENLGSHREKDASLNEKSNESNKSLTHDQLDTSCQE